MTRKGREALPGRSDSLSAAGQMGEETAGRSGKGHDFDGATGDIIGMCIEVHETPGPGFREITYQRALRLEIEARALDFSREQNIPIYHKGRKIDTRCAEIKRLINTVRDQTPEEARPQESAARPAERAFASFATPSRRSWSEPVPHGQEPRGGSDTLVMEPFASFYPFRALRVTHAPNIRAE